jgi:hypothetical protein
MGNYFSSKNKTDKDLKVSDDCDVTIFVSVKNIGESEENETPLPPVLEQKRESDTPPTSEIINQSIDEANRPENELNQPENVVKQPEDVVKQPEDVVKQPEDVVKQPEDVVKQPEDVVKQPEDVVKQPEDVVKQPEDVVKQPEDVVKQSRMRGGSFNEDMIPQAKNTKKPKNKRKGVKSK